MRVAFNALHLVPGETGGMEPYARRLLAALAEEGIEPIVYASREAAGTLEGEVVELPVEARSRARRVLAEQTLLPRALRRSRAALLHNLFTTAPGLPGLPQVTTIHDVIYRTHPEAHRGLMGRGLAMLVPLAARRSRRIITVSQASKQAIVRHLRVEPARVDVVYNGPGLREPSEPLPAAEVRERLGVEGPLVLTVAALRGHKNLVRLFDAIARLEVTLVASGYPTAHEQELRDAAERAGVADRVRLPGWVDDATLDGLYRACDCFVLPSLAEGFGLPVLEALRRGAAVACSDIPALREVAGGDATYFDPRDPDAIAAAIRSARPVPGAAERAARFSWELAARGTIASYERALVP